MEKPGLAETEELPQAQLCLQAETGSAKLDRWPKEKEKGDCISGNDVFDNTYTHCMSLYCSNVKCGWNVPK